MCHPIWSCPPGIEASCLCAVDVPVAGSIDRHTNRDRFGCPGSGFRPLLANRDRPFHEHPIYANPNPGIPPFPDGDHRTIGRQVNEILSRLPKKRQNDEPGQRNLSRLSQKRRNDEPGQQNPSRSTRGSHGITQVNSSAKHWPSQHHYRCPAQASSSRRAAKRGQSVFIAVRSLRLGTSSIGTQQISMLSSSFALGSTVWPGFSKANTVV